MLAAINCIDTMWGTDSSNNNHYDDDDDESLNANTDNDADFQSEEE